MRKVAKSSPPLLFELFCIAVSTVAALGVAGELLVPITEFVEE